MHEIEPFYNWRHLYVAEEDERSPFFGTEHSEFQYTATVYNYYIHPQWDDFGSRTLYIKVQFVDYEAGYAIFELLGEWNDAIENDIMTLKRDVVDLMIQEGISKYIVIAENVLNFHSSDGSYYEEWQDDIRDEGGWVVLLNLPEASQHDFRLARLMRYLEFAEYPEWRTLSPQLLFVTLDNLMLRRLNN